MVMNEMKKLSIVVPVYNAEKTLHRCVDSILNQEYSDLEIILVDDGSDDDSLAICQKYAEYDTRVIVYHKQNGGLVAARKAGVALATGAYIGFVDSDDYIDADMYSSLMKEVYEKNSDIVIGGIKHDYPNNIHTSTLNLIPIGYYDINAVKEIVIPQMLTKRGFYKYGIIPGVVVKVFEKSLIQKSLDAVDNDITLGEDVAITSYAITFAASISVVESAGYHYVQTETSMIRGFNPNHFNALCKMFRCIDPIQNSDYREQIGAYFACVLYGILADFLRHSKLEDRKRLMMEMLKDPITEKALEQADVSGWPFLDRIKFFFMKYKMGHILTAILVR